MAEYPVKLGVIGGSGVYEMEGVELVKQHDLETPFGKPSDKIMEVRLEGKTAYFLPRHGKGHRLTPSEVNYRANVYALKSLGVTHVLAVSAVGIMQEDIHPGDMVVPDQMFDRTKGQREASFFGNGVVGHIEFADPFDQEMLSLVAQAAKAKMGDKVHTGGAYVCIEGPQFSTRAESRHYRETLKPSVIGMTGLPEAKLVREAEMCYGMLALATDYDCWKEGADDVSVEAILAILKANSENAKAIVRQLISKLPEVSSSPNLEAAKFAIITSPDAIPAQRREELALLYGKYLG
ncbi:S-methyl-5'-thioadenosine phosphorylase [Pseudobacteriovorax antillogorgiicola]|uniref:S-methyl-5'-thioadenosine phosphorylase n=1 Tax=Pseudobacteriovorax antillogorgiicola TaxID=1513793 RepID=A0A1Y6CRB0_9BACT|nr:S-methyl-5'-thioadenosine phosphorylase [Pseudobacteriovorax antillogorgiicola]TCS45859.1 methylthioadenosine phosphorylase [Pseudobacteriovorax antillogorgiicola]SMF71358.1 methylthioadenosine phosphorylase [Pseudobacteriovorax antillogorgiicola]